MDEQEQEAFADFVGLFGPLIQQAALVLDNVSLSFEDDMSNEELINKIQEYIAQNDLPDEMVIEGASIICDLEQNPYFGEEDSDKYSFQHAGRLCTLRRNSNNKSWLAYVEYTHYSVYEDIPVEVHGCLTYGNGHKVGMNFAHHNDIIPKYFYSGNFSIEDNAKYRDYAYVKAEVESLAEQLNELPQLDVGVSDSDLPDDLPDLIDTEESEGEF
tara:strand:- start:3049 stop:3690 length:642 start_codon:yes stop_codon:yes gene_type:complete